ncbi:MAG TPA: WbuC family cupin fold metalloprotein [Pseudomonadales bacterium]|nr:WbuC family cupin fold metalloprotein [Pseudomonadales bacterium]
MISLSNSDLDQLAAAAAAAPRKRSNRNLHQSLDAKVQRLAISMEPDTYVRPHRHPQTWELYLPLRGAFKVVLFNEAGSVTDCIQIGEGGLVAYELPANTWHSVVSLQPGSIIFEVKEGPYIQPSTADVAAWSPAEGADGVAQFQAFLLNAQPGQSY